MNVPIEFATLVEPIGVEGFVADHWGRRSLFSPGSAVGSDGLLTTAEFFAAAERPGARIKAAYSDPEGRHQEFWVPGRLAAQLHGGGMTICAADIGAQVPRLRAVAQSVRKSLAFPGMALFNCYNSPPGTGFNTHFDAQHVLVIQLEGEKTWWYGDAPSVPNPPENLLAERAEENRARYPQLDLEVPQLTERTLRPGDVLYLAPGTWHRARAGTQGSLALTLSLIPVRVCELVSSIVMSRLDDDAAGRSTAPLAANDAGPHDELESALARYKAAVDSLSRDDLALALQKRIGA